MFLGSLLGLWCLMESYFHPDTLVAGQAYHYRGRSCVDSSHQPFQSSCPVSNHQLSETLFCFLLVQYTRDACMYGWLRRYEVEVAEYIPIFPLREVERQTFLRPE